MTGKDIQKVFSKNLKRLLEENNTTQLELSKFLNVSNTTVNNYIKGYNMPRMDKIDKICEFFNIQRSELISEKTELSVFGSIERTRSYPFIPNPVAAGVPETIDGISQLDKITVPDFMLGKYAGNPNLIIMKVNGESMNKIIPNGSYIGVLFDYPVVNLKDGDMVVFSKDYDYSLKHYYNSGDKIIFKPNSTDVSFADVVVNKDESLNIVGKVVMYVKIYD